MLEEFSIRCKYRVSYLGDDIVFFEFQVGRCAPTHFQNFAALKVGSLHKLHAHPQLSSAG